MTASFGLFSITFLFLLLVLFVVLLHVSVPSVLLSLAGTMRQSDLLVCSQRGEKQGPVVTGLL